MDWAEYEEAKRCRGLDQDLDPVEEPVSEVEKQNYYNRNGIEAKDIIRAIYQYYGSDLMRYKYKGNAKKDLDKSIVNVIWLKKEI